VPIPLPDPGSHQKSEPVRLPVTVVCGFVGAGKSTLVRKVVGGWASGRLAVLVHDRSDAGLDTDLCRSQDVEVFRLGEVLAELVQRCVGCSLRDGLTSAITAIADMGRFDRLLVECSGLVEPVLVAEIFNDAWENQEPLASKARLDHLITVVDSRTLWDDLHAEDDLQTRGVSCGTDDGRTISELVVEQVEYATVLVMSKTEGLPSGRQRRLRHLLEALNPEAVILSMVEESDLVRQILGERTQASMPISFQPGWVKLIQGAPMPTIQSTHWTMGVFRATRPFHPERLWDLIESNWPGILRCKGHFWIASQPERCFSWEQTAGVRHFECVGDWWVATPRDEWPTSGEFEARLKQNWSVEFGDRRQAFGWIGYRLDATSWRRRLQSCLLTPSEVLDGESTWHRFDDPFARAISHADTGQDDGESD
jgi:G3E family GTPase